MFKVSNGQDPYSAIGKYIRDHITAIEDIIAVIKINEAETNQLFTVDINEENYFIWENDWWEGEEDVTLIDFFPVSEAQRANQSVQSADTISRQAALQAMDTWDKFGCDPDGKLVRYDDDKHYIPYVHYEDMVHAVKHLPSAQPEVTKDTNVPSTDTISRRDVMRVLASLSYNQCKTQGEADVIDIAKTMVITMPSAQPDLQQTCNQLATDCISRQIILSYIDRIKNQGTGKKKSLDYLGKYVSKLPSAQPERKKGKWIRHPTNREYDICTSCHIGTKLREYGENDDGTEWRGELNFAFCPWCGADMREEGGQE